MAPLLYRLTKEVNLFCTSPASTAACTGEPRRRPVGRGWYSIPHLRRQKRQALNWVPHPQKSGWGSGNTGGLLSPTASARYLLGEVDGSEAFSDDYPDLDALPAWIPVDSARFHSVTQNDDSATLKPSTFASSSSSSSSVAAALPSARFQTGKGDDDVAARERSSTVARSQGQASFGVSSSWGLCLRATSDEDSAVPKPSCSSKSQDQVVVLRVSLHCKGCEGKVRKHISRMEGVTSFNIDFATKKVTVVGNVTPLGVLSSISKVKNAQLWTSP